MMRKTKTLSNKTYEKYMGWVHDEYTKIKGKKEFVDWTW